MKLENIHIWMSPLTKKVYVGTLSEEDGSWVAKEKIDRTDEFIGTMIRFLREFEGEVEITEHNLQKNYYIKLEEDDER